MSRWRAFLWAPVAVLASLRVDLGKDPVIKVVSLLEDMEKQLEADAKKDEEVYDKMACWCTETQKSKQAAIEEGSARIESLAAEIEQGIALSARLGPEIESLQKEAEKNQQALQQATAIREKQVSEFEAESKDLQESISAVRKAVKAGKSKSFLQTSSRNAALAFAKSRRWLEDVPRRFQVADLLQYVQPGQSSEEIFGMLSQMLETFQQDLKEMQDEETSNKAAYEKLKEAKAEEIEMSAGQIRVKQKEKATADEQLAQNKKEKGATTTALDEDNKFLVTVKSKCTNSDVEWDARQKTRREEVKAISAATQVLSDGREKLVKTTSFFQRSSHHKLQRAGEAKLLAAAQQLHSPRLSLLALRAKSDSLEEVSVAIDNMIAELKKQKKAELEKRTFCTDQFTENKAQQEKQDRKKEDASILLEALDEKTTKLTGSKSELEGQVQTLNKELAKAAQDREEQNKAFQLSVGDQRETQKLLQAALKVLADFYGKSLVQLEAQRGQTLDESSNELQADDLSSPKGFDEYKKSAGSKGVIAMLQHIMDQAKEAEKQAIKDENTAQSDYEELAKETAVNVASKNKEVAGLQASITKAQGEKADAKTDRKNILAAKEALVSAAGTLHSDCDFLIQNFQTRQTAIDDEVTALVEAKAVMQGITASDSS
ncbi:unnamed protein product [Effrenium voratum]|nr:unnamed protein product [Effrenium voratum]|mmetsp:Transcript_55386/g.132305  ORF Transcript_55386/g.132305 Transcript_55386/m.132305 type:complete len:659 (+) Transcript_55386:69-2045(+)|eukprot:CAMPEP_0181429608 /NCGR_PEP_ID=MMETSP1110-20121109/17289_1 /TAXON_ID=174948 /ORGANISM="Symbiodinium sp., Strain CCMP421" /LENGTH=658 /DNA_ID=CAMNT_0023552885 /DNA_START=39 /DNA_END=2015 /DNA_ORIENTATION=-